MNSNMNGKSSCYVLAYVLFSVSFFLFSVTLTAQNRVQGKVFDSQKVPMELVNVMLSDSTNSHVIAYSSTQEDGSYSLKTNKLGKMFVKYSFLGYVSHTAEIMVKKGVNPLADVFLEEKAFELEEVVLRSEPPIAQRQDTIKIITKFFTDGTEKNVEEMLKKIPGLRIDSDGTVKVGNKEVEKIMVEGDDFFGKGYQTLSKNMPAHPIEEIEILNHYSENRLLKDIEESDNVALNLKLNEKSKRVWFGNADVAYGLVSENRYQVKANLMNFGKKNKYYFLTNLNNVGDNTFLSVQGMDGSVRFGQSIKMGDNQKAVSLINLSPPQLGFKQIRSRNNNAELISLNGIFNPAEKLKIKAQGFFNWDEVRFSQNSISHVQTANVQFTNTQDYQLDNKTKVFLGKLETTYEASENRRFQSVTQLNYTNFNDYAHLLFNGDSTLENLKHRNNVFNHMMTYTYKLKERNAILVTGSYIRESTPQDYTVNRFFFSDLFPNVGEVDAVKQHAVGTMDFIGINATFINRNSKKHLFEIQLGNEYKKECLEGQFSIFQKDTELNDFAGFQHQTTFYESDLYLKTRYNYPISQKHTLTTRIDLHQFFNGLTTDVKQRQSVFYANPSVGFLWQVSKNNLLNLSYSYNNSNAQMTDIYNGFVLTRFNSFSKGTGTLNRLDTSNLSLNYSLGNWSDRFFATAFLLYQKKHNFLSTNALINEQFSIYEKIRIQNREMLLFNTKIDYYFRALFTNLKLDLGYNQLDFKNIVNDSQLRVGESHSYTYGFELRSVFRGIFNYNLGSKWENSRMDIDSFSNTYLNNISFVDLNFNFSKKTALKTQFERYSFGNLPVDKEYYFLDFELEHKILDNKLTIAIVGKNLLNTAVFRTYLISDISHSTTEYRLLPRFALLRMIYQF